MVLLPSVSSVKKEYSRRNSLLPKARFLQAQTSRSPRDEDGLSDVSTLTPLTSPEASPRLRPKESGVSGIPPLLDSQVTNPPSLPPRRGPQIISSTSAPPSSHTLQDGARIRAHSPRVAQDPPGALQVVPPRHSVIRCASTIAGPQPRSSIVSFTFQPVSSLKHSLMKQPPLKH